MKIQNKEHMRLAGIFGTGRSGSSWLGSIIDSHPQVLYRFEPFHRLSRRSSAVGQAQKLLESEQLKDHDLSIIYESLIPAHPIVDRPPFFAAKDHGGSIIGKSWLRPLAHSFKALASLYIKLYTPRGDLPYLVFKEVSMEPMMANILTHTSMKVIYLVRHPCAVVNSKLRGNEAGVMPLDRQNLLEKRLNKHDKVLAKRYADQIEHLSIAEKEALTWRIDVEKGITAAQAHSHALIIIYETLCQNPLAVAQQIFKHLDLNFSPQTSRYLESLTNQGSKQQWIRYLHYKELLAHSYFSVIHNPTFMKDKWKQQLPLETQGQILKLVQDSPAFQFCAHLGGWEDTHPS